MSKLLPVLIATSLIELVVPILFSLKSNALKASDRRPPLIRCHRHDNPSQKAFGKVSEDSYAYGASYDSVDFNASYIVEPQATLLTDIADSELPDGLPDIRWKEAIKREDDITGTQLDDRIRTFPEMVAFQMKGWNVSVMIYSQPFKADGIHSASIAKCGSWDGPTVMALCEAYKKHGSRGAIIDVGANIGAYTMPLAQCLNDAGSSDRVISIEADARNNLHLRAAIKFNKLENIHLYEYAVGAGSSGDTVTMHQGLGNHGLPHVVAVDGNPVSQGGVPVTTVDAILAQEGHRVNEEGLRVFAMKMDIEGYEPQALQGAQNLLQKHAPCIINIEVHSTGDQTAPMLAAAGYIRKEPHPDPHNKADAWFEREDFDSCVAALQR